MPNQDRANSPSRPHTEQAKTASIIPRDQHPMSRKQISQAALNIMYDLNRAGYEAYLVGGCIRDLLLDNTPKDFDVATNATPEQVHALFRRSRIVGRRFRIVHVRVGPEVIEVTTLAKFDPTRVNMLSLVLVGNSQTRLLGNAMFTPRGYASKLGA